MSNLLREALTKSLKRMLYLAVAIIVNTKNFVVGRVAYLLFFDAFKSRLGYHFVGVLSLVVSCHPLETNAGMISRTRPPTVPISLLFVFQY